MALERAFNQDDLIIDMMLSATMFDKDSGNVLFSATMLEEPSIEQGGEKVYATDNYGVNIAAFNRSKTLTFSATNSLFNLGLLAQQWGSEKETGESIAIPMREYLKVGAEKTVDLKYTPIEGTISVAVADSGKSLIGVNIKQDLENGFTVSEKKITFTGEEASVEENDYVMVYYKYSGTAVQVVNSADAFTVAGEMRIEILFSEKCNQALQHYGYLVLPSAVLDNNATINLTTDGKHPFSVEAMADYCSTNHELCYIVVPEDAAA